MVFIKIHVLQTFNLKLEANHRRKCDFNLLLMSSTGLKPVIKGLESVLRFSVTLFFFYWNIDSRL